MEGHVDQSSIYSFGLNLRKQFNITDIITNNYYLYANLLDEL